MPRGGRAPKGRFQNPVPERGTDSVERYVRLFAEIILDRTLSRLG